MKIRETGVRDGAFTRLPTPRSGVTCGKQMLEIRGVAFVLRNSTALSSYHFLV